MSPIVIPQFCRLTIHRGLCLPASLMVLAILLALSTSAHAQTCTSNLDFRDVNTGFFTNKSSALSQIVSGNISGSIRNGVLQSVSITFRPQTVNPVNNIELIRGSYNAGSNAVRPIYTCSESTNTVHLTISKVPTRIDYPQTGTFSMGLATITMIADKKGGAGRLDLQYKHEAFSRLNNPNAKLFNGLLLFEATP